MPECWRSLTAWLGARLRIITPDLLGYGDNPLWSRSRSLRLEVDVRSLLPMIASAVRPVDVRAERVPYTPFTTRAA